MSKCTCPFDCSACEEFSKTKKICSTHKQDCSWYNDNKTCSCFLFSPLGIYTPYVPLQVSNIFKKDETMTNCPECSTGVLQETSFIEEGKTVEVIGCNRCRYSDFNVVESEK